MINDAYGVSLIRGMASLKGKKKRAHREGGASVRTRAQGQKFVGIFFFLARRKKRDSASAQLIFVRFCFRFVVRFLATAPRGSDERPSSRGTFFVSFTERTHIHASPMYYQE